MNLAHNASREGVKIISSWDHNLTPLEQKMDAQILGTEKGNYFHLFP
jgi:hypothetical protein